MGKGSLGALGGRDQATCGGAAQKQRAGTTVFCLKRRTLTAIGCWPRFLRTTRERGREEATNSIACSFFLNKGAGAMDQRIVFGTITSRSPVACCSATAPSQSRIEQGLVRVRPTQRRLRGQRVLGSNTCVGRRQNENEGMSHLSAPLISSV